MSAHRRPPPRSLRGSARLGCALVLGLGLTTGAQAYEWERAPARYVGRVEFPIVVQWEQARLQSDCGNAEATAGRLILGCSWTMGSVCFIATWTGLSQGEAAALIRWHEEPHCVGWTH